jgi:hypothetical protein
VAFLNKFDGILRNLRLLITKAKQVKKSGKNTKTVEGRFRQVPVTLCKQNKTCLFLILIYHPMICCCCGTELIVLFGKGVFHL